MKRMLSFKNLLLATVAAFAISSANAQTTITTAYTNNPGHAFGPGTAGVSPWGYVTFNVQNSNCYPVTITDMSTFHFSDFGGIFSQNGAVYTLLYTSTNMPPAIPTVPTGYTIIASSAPITTSSNGIVPILSGMNFVIPANTTYRLALYISDTVTAAGTPVNNTVFPPTPKIVPTPGTFTQNGVTVTSVGAPLSSTSIIVWTAGAVTNFSIPDDYGWDGSLTFRASGPTATALGNNACVGDSITLSATLLPPPCIPATATINWVGPAAPGTHTGATWKIEATQANAGQYFVTWTDGTNTSAPTAVTVTVTPPPPAPGISGKFAYCVNEQFEPVTVTGTNILWYINPTGGTGTTIPAYVNTTQPGSYTWYVSQTTSNGCESPRTRLNITVAPKPAPPVVVSPIGYCENSPADSLTAGGQNLKWYNVSAGGLGSIFAPTPNTSVKDTLTWFVSQTIDGCESKRSKIDVVVTFRPNGMVVVSRTPNICAGDTLSFYYYGSGTPTTAYDWSIPPVGTSIIAGAGGPGPFVVRFDTAGLQEVTLHPGNLGCYGSIYSQTVKVKEIPHSVIAAPQNVCKDATGTVSLFSYTDSSDVFTWGWDGGVPTYYSVDQGPYGIIWPTTGKKIITLTLTKEGCSGTDADTIIVRELPDAKITGYDGRVICKSDSVLLQPNTVVASSKYQWSPADFFGEYANLPIANAEVDFDDMVRLDVTDEFGCINADSVSFKTKACCEITFPTAFTPNNDGKNDKFHPVYIGNKDKSYQNEGDKKLKTLRIVNRWGQAVFESANSNVGWDGNMNGEPQDMGTYYYFVSFECAGKITEQKGEFFLVR